MREGECEGMREGEVTCNFIRVAKAYFLSLCVCVCMCAHAWIFCAIDNVLLVCSVNWRFAGPTYIYIIF